MSVDKLRRVRDDWRRDELLQSKLNLIFDRLDFTDKFIEYVTRRERSFPRKSKQIKDNQWGMIELDWRAVRLIDCPLVQRLRFYRVLRA